MTLDEAKKVARDPWNKHEMHTLVEAVIALSDALQPAEGQVAAMREAAAKVAEYVAAQWSGVRDRDVGDCMTGIAKAIRAMPAPAVTPPAPVFDAEAALVAQAAQIRHAIGSGRQYVTADDLLLAYEAGIAAGRKP